MKITPKREKRHCIYTRTCIFRVIVERRREGAPRRGGVDSPSPCLLVSPGGRNLSSPVRRRANLAPSLLANSAACQFPQPRRTLCSSWRTTQTATRRRPTSTTCAFPPLARFAPKPRALYARRVSVAHDGLREHQRPGARAGDGCAALRSVRSSRLGPQSPWPRSDRRGGATHRLRPAPSRLRRAPRTAH